MSVGALFSRHGEALLRLARRITGSDADSEEAVADTFLALVAKDDPLDPERDPWPYLRRAVLNRSLNVLRRRRRAPAIVPNAVLDRRAARNSNVALLRDGLARLSERQGEVFALRHIEGLTTAEVAEALGIAPATVRVHLPHAVRTLRALFDPTEARHA